MKLSQFEETVRHGRGAHGSPGELGGPARPSRFPKPVSSTCWHSSSSNVAPG